MSLNFLLRLKFSALMQQESSLWPGPLLGTPPYLAGSFFVPQEDFQPRSASGLFLPRSLGALCKWSSWYPVLAPQNCKYQCADGWSPHPLPPLCTVRWEKRGISPDQHRLVLRESCIFLHGGKQCKLLL